ncbi:AbiJ-NTD4 domain-containing protein [Loktanella agnita]|uniref:AbiJ-NTD4 domain-containing protein n=1 Tax=Loktanella agnita TaxID=287097 RepID=UPI003987EF25
MSDFASRYGYVPVAVDLAETEMPSSLRSGLWDVVSNFYFSDIHAQHSIVGGTYSKYFSNLTNDIWFNYFREPADSRPKYCGDAVKLIRGRFFEWKFYEVYEFVEFISARTPVNGKSKSRFTESANFILSREKSAFRFAGNFLVKLSDENQLVEVAAASQSASEAVNEHIKLAAKHYSNTNSPDYRNSIKESISAAEAAVSFVTGRKPSGISRPLKNIAATYQIHPALRDGFEKIYAWTSDDSGIRHSLMTKSTVTQEEARFMLISCSAFANYLLALRIRFGEISEE